MRFVSLKVLFFLYLASSTAQAYIKLLPDGETDEQNYVEIPFEHAQYSTVFKNMLNDLSNSSFDTPTQLHGSGISLNTLCLVAQCLRYIHLEELPAFMKELQGLWNLDFIEFSHLGGEIKKDYQAFFDLMCAAVFLDIPELISSCSKLWIELNFSDEVIAALKKSQLHQILSLNDKLSFDFHYYCVPQSRQFAKVHHYLLNKIAIVQKELERNNPISSICFSPNGDFFAVASWGNNLNIYEVYGKYFSLYKKITNQDPVMSVFFNHDGTQLTLRLLNNTIITKNVLNKFSTVSTTKETDQNYHDVICSDNKFIAVRSNINGIKIRDASNYATLRYTLDGHDGLVTAACFSSDSLLFVSTSSDHTIKIWDTTDNFKLLRTLNGHNELVLSVCFSPNNEYLISCSQNTIKIWHVAKGFALMNTLHGDSFSSATCSPDGEFLVAACGKKIMMWRVNSLLCFEKVLSSITLNQLHLLRIMVSGTKENEISNLFNENDILMNIYNSLPKAIKMIIEI